MCPLAGRCGSWADCSRPNRLPDRCIFPQRDACLVSPGRIAERVAAPVHRMVLGRCRREPSPPAASLRMIRQCADNGNWPPASRGRTSPIEASSRRTTIKCHAGLPGLAYQAASEAPGFIRREARVLPNEIASISIGRAVDVTSVRGQPRPK
jgi:hypothetical protein